MIIIIYIVLKFFKKKKEKFLVFTTQVKVTRIGKCNIKIVSLPF